LSGFDPDLKRLPERNLRESEVMDADFADFFKYVNTNFLQRD